MLHKCHWTGLFDDKFTKRNQFKSFRAIIKQCTTNKKWNRCSFGLVLNLSPFWLIIAMLVSYDCLAEKKPQIILLELTFADCYQPLCVRLNWLFRSLCRNEAIILPFKNTISTGRYQMAMSLRLCTQRRNFKNPFVYLSKYNGIYLRHTIITVDIILPLIRLHSVSLSHVEISIETWFAHHFLSFQIYNSHMTSCTVAAPF